MATKYLGRLDKVELREAWLSEAGEFTPWLAHAENLVLLGEAIGLDLELDCQEKSVGPFRADILCKNLANDSWVLIENQLERTDHTHLGQLLTYAAGLKAVTIIWIAQRITAEHRAALDWLNEITEEGIDFFGLEIELWKIGDSPIAPKFNVVCQPNEWTKTVVGGANTSSEAGRIQLEFWTAFREYIAEHPASFRCSKAQPQNWMSISIGKTGFQLAAVASTWDSESGKWTGELRAELYIGGKDAKAYYALLENEKAEINHEIGEEPVWYNPEKKQACKVYLRKAVDLFNRDDWPSQHAWMREKLQRLYEVFKTRVKQLSLEEAAIYGGDGNEEQ